METHKEPKIDQSVMAMFKVGAHYGYPRSRRHPSVKPYIYGTKNKVEIFDLEKTQSLLNAAKAFVSKLSKEGKQIVFVASKNEAKDIVKQAALSLGLPYVAGRWVGGTFTNFGVIRGRVDKMLDLLSKRERNELSKYTKKERLLIDREITRLETLFSGIVPMKGAPSAMFVIDPGKEEVAVAEAKKVGIPVIALVSSDCDISLVDYPIVANDSSVASISFFTDEIVSAFKEGRGA